MLRRFSLLLALVLAVTSAGCGSNDDRADDSGANGTGTSVEDTAANPSAGGRFGAPPRGPKVTITVGSVASESGSGQPYGIGQLQGTQLALELLAEEGHWDATVVNVDDQSTPAGGTTAITRLLEQDASVIVGPTLSPVAAEADKVAQAAGVPVLAVTNTTLDIDAIGDVVWRVSLTEDTMIPQSVEVAKDELDLSTAALVYQPGDEYSVGAAAAFRQAAQTEGVQLVADLPYTAGQTDVRQLLREASASAPDALFLAARSDFASELLLAADELGLQQVLVGGNGFNAPDVLAKAGATADGLIVSASWNIDVENEQSRRFVDIYRERFGTDPDAFAAQAFAGVQVLAAAIGAGGGATPAQILDGLRQLDSVETVLGTMTFTDREAQYDAAVQVIEGGTFVLLEG
jgi:branched-chain amino acid transport system substrate-binding protein